MWTPIGLQDAASLKLHPLPGGRVNHLDSGLHGLPFVVCTNRAYTSVVGFEWDEDSKAGINFRKHGVRMPEAIPVFDEAHEREEYEAEP